MLTTFQQVKRVSIPCLCLSKDDTIRTEDVTGIIRPLLLFGLAGLSSKEEGEMVNVIWTLSSKFLALVLSLIQKWLEFGKDETVEKIWNFSCLSIEFIENNQ